MKAEMSRRTALGLLAAAPLVRPASAAAGPVPKVGMGTWLTFDVRPENADARAQRVEVVRAFLAGGGRMIDSSPMYGMAEDVLGHCLDALDHPPVHAASKVWIPATDFGPEQMEASRKLWGIERFDLMQVHNLLSYEGHIETLRAMKAAGEVGAIGVTTSHGRRHEALAEIIERDDSLDSVQLTYNMADREAEARLLPMAAERGLQVIVNRPFRRGALIRAVAGKPLPDWAAEIGAASWPQFLLLWAISHPAVSVAIPATSQVDHMRENMAVLDAPLPDAAMRERMSAWFDSVV